MYQESRYTAPRPDCLNPEYWHTVNGRATEVEVSSLVQAMVRALQPELVLETGTDAGQTASLIGDALKRNGHGKLITIEIRKGRVLEARKKLKGLPVEVVHGDCLKYTPPSPVDFLWIDGLPMDLRMQEWERFKPFLSSRGVVMFHDTGPHRQNFRSALDADYDLDLIHLPTPRGVSIGRLRE